MGSSDAACRCHYCSHLIVWVCVQLRVSQSGRGLFSTTSIHSADLAAPLSVRVQQRCGLRLPVVQPLVCVGACVSDV